MLFIGCVSRLGSVKVGLLLSYLQLIKFSSMKRELSSVYVVNFISVCIWCGLLYIVSISSEGISVYLKKMQKRIRLCVVKIFSSLVFIVSIIVSIGFGFGIWCVVYYIVIRVMNVVMSVKVNFILFSFMVQVIFSGGIQGSIFRFLFFSCYSYSLVFSVVVVKNFVIFLCYFIGVISISSVFSSGKYSIRFVMQCFWWQWLEEWIKQVVLCVFLVNYFQCLVFDNQCGVQYYVQCVGVDIFILYLGKQGVWCFCVVCDFIQFGVYVLVYYVQFLCDILVWCGNQVVVDVVQIQCCCIYMFQWVVCQYLVVVVQLCLVQFYYVCYYCQYGQQLFGVCWDVMQLLWNCLVQVGVEGVFRQFE